MEKTELLLKTESLIRAALPATSDSLLQAGFSMIQRHVLNYYRQDLDYPPHSARAIVKLTSSMIRYYGTFGYEELTGTWEAYRAVRALRSIWVIELRG
jgi:hypothetical protein